MNKEEFKLSLLMQSQKQLDLMDYFFIERFAQNREDGEIFTNQKTWFSLEHGLEIVLSRNNKSSKPNISVHFEDILEDKIQAYKIALPPFDDLTSPAIPIRYYYKETIVFARHSIHFAILIRKAFWDDGQFVRVETDNNNIWSYSFRDMKFDNSVYLASKISQINSFHTLRENTAFLNYQFTDVEEGRFTRNIDTQYLTEKEVSELHQILKDSKSNFTKPVTVSLMEKLNEFTNKHLNSK